jgi:pimeloyl-ACP methyl ester carboxylesterase
MSKENQKNKNKANAKFIAIGHSGGGALLAATRFKYPHLFGNLIMYDPAFFGITKRIVFALGLRIPGSFAEFLYAPLKIARKRTSEWPTQIEAEAFIRSRRLFQQFDREIIDSFLKYGLVAERERGKNVTRLAFPTEAEVNMMRSVPTNVPYLSVGSTRLYQEAESLQGTYIFSKKHDFISSGDLSNLQSLFAKFNFEGVEHGHFWPLIQPASFASHLASSILKA